MLYAHEFKLILKLKIRTFKTVFLKIVIKIPYPITTETTKERYLSGADFDTESIQVINDEFI